MGNSLKQKFFILSKIIYKSRKNFSYTLKELAYASGVSSSLISTLENCKTNSIPTQKTLMMLERALLLEKQELQILFDYTPTKNPYSYSHSTSQIDFIGWNEVLSDFFVQMGLADTDIKDIIKFIEIRKFLQKIEEYKNLSFKIPENLKLKYKLAFSDANQSLPNRTQLNKLRGHK